MAEIHHLPITPPAAGREVTALGWLPFETVAMGIVLIAASGNWRVALVALVWSLMRARA